jgi:hypothetical protein
MYPILIVISYYYISFELLGYFMHLFYRCHKIKQVLDELKHIFNSIFENNIVLVEENLIIVVYEGEITEDILLMNLVICIFKWVIWKTNNYIKYNKSIYREEISFHKMYPILIDILA